MRRRLFTVLAGLLLFVEPTFQACLNGTTALNGVNLPALSYSYSDGTWKGQSPPLEDVMLYKNQGFNIFRYAFNWNLLQPDPTKPFDDKYYQVLKQNVSYIASNLNLTVILDYHSFGQYNGSKVGQPGSNVTNEQFAQMWKDLTQNLPSNNVIIGLMNEPTEAFEPHSLQITLQTAINELRTAGRTDYIFVPSNNYQGMSKWSHTADYSLAITDPKNKLIYDIHSYFDNRGGAINCTPFVSDWLSYYEDVTSRIRQKQGRAFLSEIGGRATAQCAQVISDALQYLDTNNDVWMGWTAWGSELSQPNPRDSTDKDLSLTAFFTDCGDGDLIHQAFLAHGAVSTLQNSSNMFCTPQRDSLATAPANTLPVTKVSAIASSTCFTISTSASSQASSTVGGISVSPTSPSSSPSNTSSAASRPILTLSDFLPVALTTFSFICGTLLL